MAAKRACERKKLVDECIEANKNLDELSLLNWSMNQLFRAARELELLSAVYCNNESIPSMGCDAAATVILERLIKTKEGWDVVSRTNRKLLEGYKKPNV